MGLIQKIVGYNVKDLYLAEEATIEYRYDDEKKHPCEFRWGQDKSDRIIKGETGYWSLFCDNEYSEEFFREHILPGDCSPEPYGLKKWIIVKKDENGNFVSIADGRVIKSSAEISKEKILSCEMASDEIVVYGLSELKTEIFDGKIYGIKVGKRLTPAKAKRIQETVTEAKNQANVKILVE